jgi:hypothetical protein
MQSIEWSQAVLLAALVDLGRGFMQVHVYRSDRVRPREWRFAAVVHRQRNKAHAGAKAKETRGSFSIRPRSRSPFSRYSAGPLAQALGKSTRIIPSTARKPQRIARRAVTSGKKYMSLKQVTPPDHFRHGEVAAITHKSLAHPLLFRGQM